MKKVLTVGLSSVLFWLLAFAFFWRGEPSEEGGEILKVGLYSTTPERLKGEAVMEWLGLSLEHPQQLASYPVKEGVERLLKSGVIKEALLYRLPPSALVVRYTLREPFAYASNWKNCALDAEGRLFPFSPFFSPKELPEIVFSPHPERNYTPFDGVPFQEFPLAKQILGKKSLISPWHFSRIDLSRLDPDHPLGGEMVLTLKEGDKELLVRLWEENWEERLQILARILDRVEGKNGVDLRLSSGLIIF